MRKPQIERKHIVYAEDILYELMQYPDNMIYKYDIRRLVNKVISEKELPASAFIAYSSYYEEDDGDIYD